MRVGFQHTVSGLRVEPVAANCAVRTFRSRRKVPGAGGWVGWERSERRLFRLKGSSGFGDGEFIGVLRLRCAQDDGVFRGEINCRGKSFPIWEMTRVGDGAASFGEYRGLRVLAILAMES